MRVFLVIFFAIIFLGVLGLTFSGKGNEASPLPAVQKFLKHVGDANYEATVRDFGGNTCRCPAKLGWVAYLIYSSGEDPNLAFLMGRKFEVGKMRWHKVHSKVKAKTPLDNPEDYEVDVPLSFNQDRPYFLPLDLAYGHDIELSALEKLLQDPDQDAWKAICLRLRRGVGSGSIAEPSETIERLKNDLSKDGGNEDISTAQLAKEMFGGEADKYSRPAECGHVLDKGVAISENELAQRLPRLKNVELRLHMVRVDNRRPFTIFHFYLADPILEMPGPGQTKSELKLKNFQPPLPEK